jgi:uncharacterized membrane protein
MNRKHLAFILPGLLITILVGGLIYYFSPRLAASSILNPVGRGVIGLTADTVPARVVEVVESGTITLGDRTQPYQILRVHLLEGTFAGRQVLIDYGQRQVRPPGLDLRPGDRVLVTVGTDQDGNLTAYFTDYIRNRPLLWLFATFVLFSILISGWKGVRSLLGLGFSLLVIISLIIPRILAGDDPVQVSIGGAFLLVSVTLYLVYGWTMKTHAAVAGMTIALVITGLLARYFIDLTRLTGFSSEEATFLIQQSAVDINLRGLVLGGMLIGALGVLDDLVATQASAVFELRGANPGMQLRTLYRSAMRIGQDHVAATVNTLVLAYAGAALPLLLLFSLSGESFAYLVNLEFVTEEIVRTLVGSLGLISSVPITTLLACLLALYDHRLGRLRRFLGPAPYLSESHPH